MLVPAIITPKGRAQRQVSSSFSLPAPTGGINARDSFTDMKPTDALGMVNVFPEATSVNVRGGYASWATGGGAAVRTLMTWQGLSGTDKIFAGAGTKIWDASAAGAMSSVVTGLTNVDFQWTNLENAGGAYLVICNGADSVRNFDGTTWTTPSITGATSSTFIQVCQFKERLWFAQKDTLDLWYLGLQSIAGAASKFPLGSVFRMGGSIAGIGTFSPPGSSGIGLDNYLAVITSNGEIAVYQGTDPTSASSFALVGLYVVGKPIGRRSMIRINGDLAIITQDGVISMQAALQFDRSAGEKAAITAKIQTLFSQYAQSYKSNFGWQPCLYPHSRYLIVNVPQIAGMTQIQLVMNTVTGAWTTFNNMNAGCWGVANDLLYFGGNDGTVYQAATGSLDNLGQINWSMQTAWQKIMGNANKLFTGVRPVMISNGSVNYNIGVDVDFQTTTLGAALATQSATGLIWSFTWPFTWGGATVLDARWQSVGSLGTWSSINVSGAVYGSTLQINSFDLIAQRGGIY